MPCNEFAKPEDVEQIRSSMLEVLRRSIENHKHVNDVINKCLDGKLTEKQAKGEIIKTFGQDPREIAAAIEKLEQRLLEQLQETPPVTKSRLVTQEDIQGIPPRIGKMKKDQFGRYDDMPNYHPNRHDEDKELKGFQSGEWAKPGHHGKVIQDSNDQYVQAVHLHRYKDVFQMSIFYKDGRTEAYNIYTGEEIIR